MRTTLGWLLVCSVLTGCASLTVREHFTQFGMPRASVDLDCPREEIELIELTSPLDKPLWSGGTQVAASGCHRKGVYVATNRGDWILNSVVVSTNTPAKSSTKRDEAPKEKRGGGGKDTKGKQRH